MAAIKSQFEGILMLSLPDDEMKGDTFYAFCRLNRELRIERNAQGQMIIQPLKDTQTGNWSATLNAQLSNWNRQQNLGKAFVNAGFILPTNAVYAPNSAWLMLAKWKELTETEREKFAPVVPDFIVEFYSTNDNLPFINHKIAEFLECGCQLAWLIDPVKQETIVYKADGSETTVPFDQMLTGEAVLPGFEVKLSELLEL